MQPVARKKKVRMTADSSRSRVLASAAPSQTARATLALREMLVQGRFRPGERIREVPLSAQLGVSRIPLRLVLERLAHEGLLEIRPTRGFVVPEFSIADIHEAIELRGVLEGTAARLAAERLRGVRDLAPLEDLNRKTAASLERRLPAAERYTQYIELNARFHAALLGLSGSRLLRRAMEQICCLPFASPSAFVMRQFTSRESQDLFFIALDQHRGIVEAIGNREGMRAESLAREHARLARRNLELVLRDRKLLRLVPGGKLIRL
jgi:GntR family transcriptional regulator of vanillate catabolism